MKMFLTKLCSSRGETLVETMVSLLIVGLASVMLITAITAASHMNEKAMEQDDVLYQAISHLEEGTASSTPGTVTVAGSNVSVTVYAEGELKAYEK